MVITELASLGAEPKVCNGGNRWGFLGLEAERPIILILVLQLQFQRLVLKVGQLELGGHTGVSDATSGAASELGVLSIVVLVVGRLSVTNHCHDIGEDDTGAIVLVRINENTKTLEVVLVTEDGTELPALFREPHGEAVAI